MALQRWMPKWSGAFVFFAAPVSAAGPELEPATVVDPGNSPDDTEFGAAAREFQIGRHAVPVGPYAVFLKAAAAAAAKGLWNSSMGNALLIDSDRGRIRGGIKDFAKGGSRLIDQPVSVLGGSMGNASSHEALDLPALLAGTHQMRGVSIEALVLKRKSAGTARAVPALKTRQSV